MPKLFGGGRKLQNIIIVSLFSCVLLAACNSSGSALSVPSSSGRLSLSLNQVGSDSKTFSINGTSPESAIITLTGAVELSNLLVTVTSSNSSIATASACTIASSVAPNNTCTTAINAVAVGSAIISATAPGQLASLPVLLNVSEISLPQTGQTPTAPVTALSGYDGYTYLGIPWARIVLI